MRTKYSSPQIEDGTMVVPIPSAVSILWFFKVDGRIAFQLVRQLSQSTQSMVCRIFLQVFLISQKNNNIWGYSNLVYPWHLNLRFLPLVFPHKFCSSKYFQESRLSRICVKSDIQRISPQDIKLQNFTESYKLNILLIKRGLPNLKLNASQSQSTKNWMFMNFI